MDHATIRDRIRALREKTQSRGCTEAEAMAAAEKAAELMRKAGLSETDLRVDEQASSTKCKGRSGASGIWRVIALCTNTKALVLIDDNETTVRFIGVEPGPEIAVYLRDICDRAIAREVRRFKKDAFYRRRRTLATKRQAVSDFTEGMVLRLTFRLRTLFQSTINSDDREIAERALKERYPDSRAIQRPQRDPRYDKASARGWVAGDNVPINHGVRERGSQELISGAGGA